MSTRAEEVAEMIVQGWLKTEPNALNVKRMIATILSSLPEFQPGREQMIPIPELPDHPRFRIHYGEPEFAFTLDETLRWSWMAIRLLRADDHENCVSIARCWFADIGASSAQEMFNKAKDWRLYGESRK